MIEKNLIKTKNFLKEIDPRIKVITAFIYSFIVAVENNFLFLLYLSIFPLFFSFFITDKKELFKKLIPVNIFLIFSWIVIPLSYPGEKIPFFIFKVSPQGVKYCLLITVKANLIVLTTAIFLTTSHFFHIIHSLHHLRVPKKLVDILYFFTRYVPVVEDETKKLKRAMKARSFVPATSLHTYRTISNLVGMIIVNSYERSEKIYKAMLARNFSGIFWVKDHFIWKKKDTLVSIILFSYFCFLCILKWKK